MAYLSKEGLLEVTPYFLYEYYEYEYWNNGVALIKNRYFKSDKYIKLKKNKSKEKGIALIGVPIEYIIDNNIPIYNPKKKKKK